MVGERLLPPRNLDAPLNTESIHLRGPVLYGGLYTYTQFYMVNSGYTLWFQSEDTVLLIGTFLLFDPVLFPIYKA